MLDGRIAINSPPRSSANGVDPFVFVIGGSDAVIAPGGILHITENNPNSWPDNMGWVNTSNGWVMLIDDMGNVRDFMSFGYSAAQLSTINLTIPGTNFTVTRADIPWVGNSLSRGSSHHERQGGDDTNENTDWVSNSSGSENNTNGSLSVPFRGSCASTRTIATVFVNNVAPLASCHHAAASASRPTGAW
jgi:hypothetical protein